MTDDLSITGQGVNFRSTLSSSVNELGMRTKAWLGALQNIAYSPDMAHDFTDERLDVRRAGSGKRAIRSDVAKSPVAWFETTNREIGAALVNATQALAVEWEKRKHGFLNTDDADAQFAKSFEQNVVQIVNRVLDAERDINNGAIYTSELADSALGRVKISPRELVHQCLQGPYEREMPSDNDPMLLLRARMNNSRSL